MKTNLSQNFAFLRPFLRIAGFAVLIGGALWAVTNLNLHWHDMALKPLLLNVALAAPAILAVAAATFQMTARAIGVDISWKTAVTTVARANVAELLPLPGGALVRAAALIQAGANAKTSAAIITATAILTLCMTVTVSSVAFAFLGHSIGWVFAGAGVAALFPVGIYVARLSNTNLLFQMIAIRTVTIGLGVIALFLAFLALGKIVAIAEVALLVVSSTLGAAVSIVPAGLGVNEAIAAALASMVSLPSAAAFLAVALNRALSLVAAAIVTLIISFK